MFVDVIRILIASFQALKMSGLLPFVLAPVVFWLIQKLWQRAMRNSSY